MSTVYGFKNDKCKVEVPTKEEFDLKANTNYVTTQSSLTDGSICTANL